MPHAIPAGAHLRHDADRLTRLTIAAASSPDLDAARAIPYDRPEYLAHLVDEVRAGRVRCLIFTRAGQRVGQVFYEVRETVFRIHGGHALPAAVPAFDFGEVMDLLETEARRLGCTAITTDTSRPGILRDHVARGYKVAEVILTKPL